MKRLKPLVACCLLGLVSLAGCGGKDTEQGTGPQQSPSPQTEQAVGPGGLPGTAPSTRQQPICRNLKEGDPGYPGWTYCCDNEDMTRSYWTGANANRSGTWDGSCSSWGIR
ncbi:hypothetical protein [Hyalangium gracile]|uniref:hypothetical protein n=1 Tax=Hyalangium gracile TaxID=394092 RepID=UPI001CCD5C9C|nr:hypothetical protein [Hyalangium gracile]